MKNSFVPVERHKEGGKVFTDADGCCYLRPHSHPLVKGKEFCHAGELLELIQDHNRLVSGKDDAAIAYQAKNGQEPFRGEVILLNVLTF